MQFDCMIAQIASAMTVPPASAGKMPPLAVSVYSGWPTQSGWRSRKKQGTVLCEQACCSSWWYAGSNSCDESSSPNYNALTLSSGSEVGLWMWRQYLMTQDKSFLQTNFSFMLEAARFLHTYATTGSDGKLTTNPSNAHEDQWAVTNPITDISAMTAFFPVVISAAQVVGSTDSLISSLQTDISKLPEIPRTNTGRNQVTTTSSDSTNIFAYSTQPTASVHNVENDDLEPVWPYDLVSDVNSNLFAIGTRTYSARAYKDQRDWSVDAIQAARLGLGSEVTARLQANIKTYQTYACGLSAWDTTKFTEPYIEESGVVAAAINEAVGTGFDGIVRLAPALPTNWSVSAQKEGRHKDAASFMDAAKNLAEQAGTPFPTSSAPASKKGKA
jgi:hypothetical protein